ncbi:Isoflavone reductase-like protein TP7 [Colletotrichum fructicola]|nr:Isoflavone reductase-like protein TP7 [Colletotrichum fructicola]KAF4916163.1 Isoflavone reductase-like protein TP7 [Colletotrichum fructicola]KAF4935516.1 Isoflavone reductase-like protein TP7 [Colletotrichum fructicola]
MVAFRVWLTRVDLEGPRVELVNVLRDVDVLILTIRYSGLGSQIPLTDAAKAASSVCPESCGNLGSWVWKEKALLHAKTISLPYTVIDVGRWYQLSIPRLPSGPLPVNFIARDGNTPSTLTDVRDVGRVTARIVADPRTINKTVLVYGAVLSQNQIFDMLDKMSCKTSKLDYMGLSAEALETALSEPLTMDAIEENAFDHRMTIFHEYWYSMGVRGDNTSEYADFLGYIDGTKLYPDFKLINFKSFLEEVLEGK